MRCPPRMRRCCAQLLVTTLVALMLCWSAYLPEPLPTDVADIGTEALAIPASASASDSVRGPSPRAHNPPRRPKPKRPPARKPPRRPSKRRHPTQPTSSSSPTITQPASLLSTQSAQVIRIIHQSWSDQNLPPMFARWSATFNACLPGFKRILWTDADNRKLIEHHYPWFLPRYDSLQAGVQRADVSRLFYMHKFGGVYCDLDCECLQGFEPLLANTSLALGAMSGTLIRSQSDAAYVAEGQVENSFMYSRPGHPFFWDLILRMNATAGDLPIMTSGTYLVMSGIHLARKTGLDRTQFQGLPYLTIYPPHLFNPYSWIQLSQHPNCRPFGDLSAESLAKCRETFANTSYIVQYHTQVWDKGKKAVLKAQSGAR